MVSQQIRPLHSSYETCVWKSVRTCELWPKRSVMCVVTLTQIPITHFGRCPRVSPRLCPVRQTWTPSQFVIFPFNLKDTEQSPVLRRPEGGRNIFYKRSKNLTPGSNIFIKQAFSGFIFNVFWHLKATHTHQLYRLFLLKFYF